MSPCYIPTFLFDVTIKHTSTEPNVTSCSCVPMSPFQDESEKILRYRWNKAGSNLTATHSVSLVVPSDRILSIGPPKGEKENERLME